MWPGLESWNSRREEVTGTGYSLPMMQYKDFYSRKNVITSFTSESNQTL